MTELVHIPLAEIDEAALPRDRGVMHKAALEELQMSIALGGLHTPIEVWRLPDPDPPLKYGLIAGYRRLAAFRDLAETGDERYAEIPAIVSQPRDVEQALLHMVEENEIRAGLSPWEKARFVIHATNGGWFATIEEAVLRLFPAASRMKRFRLRAVAEVAQYFDGALNEPESLSQKRLLLIHSAMACGYGEVMLAALEEDPKAGPGEQWRRIASYLAEAADGPAERRRRPGRPRRLAVIERGLKIRREKTRTGFRLHFTGEIADSDVMDTIFFEIERMFAPA